MAQKVQVILVDDLDGGKADVTVRFSLEGTSYEIDLSTAHAERLKSDFATWIGAARKVGSKAPKASKGSSDETAAIRAWARSTGLAVSQRGRISAEIRAAYAAR